MCRAESPVLLICNFNPTSTVVPEVASHQSAVVLPKHPYTQYESAIFVAVLKCW